MDKKKKHLKAVAFWFKAILSGIAFYYVAHKIDLRQILVILGNIRLVLVMLALVFFVLSKVFSVYRTDILMRNNGIFLEIPESIRLYWAGMFYNQFLPGGIGGDTYKIILLKNNKKVRWRGGIGIMLNDRVSGMIALLCLISATYYFIPLNFWPDYFIWITIPLFLLSYFLFLKKFYPKQVQSFIKLMGLSAGVQAMQFVSVIFLILAIDMQGHFAVLLLIFGISSVAANLPLSIGGIGIRELTFLGGAHYFSLDPGNAVTLSLLFYLISFLSAFPGIIWIFHTPFRNSKSLPVSLTPGMLRES